jgi:excisionase family DNA binding protein
MTATLISVPKLAERWDVDVKTLYGMIERGELPAVRLGRLIKISLAVVASLESQGRVVPEGT